MGQSLTVRGGVPGPRAKPWQGGQQGPNCQLLFDPDDMSLWVALEGRFHRVDNLAVQDLEVQNHYERGWDYWDRIGVPDFSGPQLVRTEVTLRALLPPSSGS